MFYKNVGIEGIFSPVWFKKSGMKPFAWSKSSRLVLETEVKKTLLGK